MRGKKGSPYDGGHRVPFLLRYPGGGAGGGRDVEQLTSYVDFMPTILDLCGVTPPPHRSFHGRSLTPLVRGEDDGTLAQRILVADTQRIANPAKWRLSSVMRGPWRLVHGLELYHLGDDPGQRRDIAAGHPEVVAELRAGYEQWWELVSEQFDRDVPMVIGQDAEPVRLTTHDMRNEACNGAWNQRQVREGYVAGGYWAIDVRRAGSYRIELRRWPEDAGYALDAGIDGDDVEWRRDAIQAQHTPHYSGGVALPIGWAALTVGGRSYHRETPHGDTAAVFEVPLEAGPDRLSAAFHDRIERTIGSYYVAIHPTDNQQQTWTGASRRLTRDGACVNLDGTLHERSNSRLCRAQRRAARLLRGQWLLGDQWAPCRPRWLAKSMPPSTRCMPGCGPPGGSPTTASFSCATASRRRHLLRRDAGAAPAHSAQDRVRHQRSVRPRLRRHRDRARQQPAVGPAGGRSGHRMAARRHPARMQIGGVLCLHWRAALQDLGLA